MNVQHRTSNIDGVTKSLKYPFFVIPAKAGIQYFEPLQNIWIPAFAGMTTFYEIVNFQWKKRSHRMGRSASEDRMNVQHRTSNVQLSMEEEKS